MPGAGISAAFDAFIGSGSGADGMTFTLADASVTKPTALGDNGGGEGFSGITGIAVSLDTWKNTNDPSNNFVGIATTNSPQQQLNYVTTNTSIPPLRNTVHHFVVTTNVDRHHRDHGRHPGAQLRRPPCRPTCSSGSPARRAGSTTSTRSRTSAITTGPPPPAPTVTAVSPTSGPTTGGTTVTVTGTNLTRRHRRAFGSHGGHLLHREQRHLHHGHRPGRARRPWT